MLLAVAACSLLALQDGKVAVRVTTTDGNSLSGSCALPSLKLKTDFGDVTVDPAKVRSITCAGGKTVVETHDDTRVEGVGTFSGPIEIETSLGKMSVKPEKVAQVVVTSQPAKPPATPPATAPAPATSPYRKIDLGADRGLCPWALPCGDGKYVAVADMMRGEVLLVDAATNEVHAVKVEARPRGLAERDGKLYVANANSSSISIVDLAQRKNMGRLALSGKPGSVTTPRNAEVLYVGTADQGVLIVDLKAGREVGALANAATNQRHRSAPWVTVSPDGAYLYIQGELEYSPRAPPELWLLEGTKALWTTVRHHEDHQPLVVDYAMNRVYGGRNAYTLDLREAAVSFQCRAVAPHPRAPVVFGLTGFIAAHAGTPAVVDSFDEETAAPITSVNIGERMQFLAATEKSVFVFGTREMIVVPVADLVPAATLGKTKKPRLPYDPAKPPPAADIARAETLAGEGAALLKDAKVDAARARFEESARLDPLGPGHLGVGDALLRAKKPAEAVEYLRAVRAFPFRKREHVLTCLVLLGSAYAAFDERKDDAIKTFAAALALGPKDAKVLDAAAKTHRRYASNSLAFIYWSRALEADPKLDRAKRDLAELEAEIRKTTTAKCESCEGKGKYERIVEEEGGPKKKIVVKCDTCDGCGRTWERPCVECSGQGRKSYDAYCDKCYGRGQRRLPAK